MFNSQHIYSFGQIQTSQTGGQPYNDTSLTKSVSVVCPYQYLEPQNNFGSWIRFKAVAAGTSFRNEDKIEETYGCKRMNCLKRITNIYTSANT